MRDARDQRHAVGTIEDSAGRPLNGAAVVVGDGFIRQAAITGADGTYRLARLLTGRTSVHVFAPGRMYDPGHHLQALAPGANSHDVRLVAQAPNAGPRFVGDPVVVVLGTVAELSVGVVAGPGAPVGTELLAVDPTDEIAVLLVRSASGIASAEIPRAEVRSDAEWLFIATDNACQETPGFPRRAPPVPRPLRGSAGRVTRMPCYRWPGLLTKVPQEGRARLRFHSTTRRTQPRLAACCLMADSVAAIFVRF